MKADAIIYFAVDIFFFLSTLSLVFSSFAIHFSSLRLDYIAWWYIVYRSTVQYRGSMTHWTQEIMINLSFSFGPLFIFFFRILF